MTGGVAEVLEQQGEVLEQFNSWPGKVLERFNSCHTAVLEDVFLTHTLTLVVLLF